MKVQRVQPSTYHSCPTSVQSNYGWVQLGRGAAPSPSLSNRHGVWCDTGRHSRPGLTAQDLGSTITQTSQWEGSGFSNVWFCCKMKFRGSLNCPHNGSEHRRSTCACVDNLSTNWHVQCNPLLGLWALALCPGCRLGPPFHNWAGIPNRPFLLNIFSVLF